MHPSLRLSLVSALFLLVLACEPPPPPADTSTDPAELRAENTAAATAVMERHLAAVAGRDLAGLRATMSPRGNMELILPGSEIISSVDSFIAFHEGWFTDTAWTFSTSIVELQADHEVAFAITDVLYEEPERDGVPYFNHMVVTYGLRKYDGEWAVVLDHASSVEKSTD